MAVLVDVKTVKTISTFAKVEDADLCRMRLGAVGIEAFVQDQNLAQLQQPWSEATGGASVEVSDEDYAAAIEFLAADKGVSDPLLPPKDGA